MDKAEEIKHYSGFKRSVITLADYLKEDKKTYAAVILLTILVGLLEFVGISSLIPAIAIIIGEKSISIPVLLRHYIEMFDPFVIGAIYAVLVLLESAIGILQEAYFVKNMAVWRTDYSIKYVKGIIDAEWSHLRKVQPGEIEVMLTRSLAIAMKLRHMTANFVSGCVLAVCYMIIAFFISPFTFLLFALLGIIFIILQKLTLKLRVRYSIVSRDMYINVARRIIEHFADMRSLLISNRDFFLRLLRVDLSEAAIMQKKTDQLNVFFRNIHQPIMLFLFCVGAFISVVFLKQPKSVLLVMLYVFYRSAPEVISIARGYGEIIGDTPIDVTPEIARWARLGHVQQKKIAPRDTGISFEGVDLRYAGEKNLLSGINLNIAPLKFVCIVGKNGTGKSTILDVICGFHKPIGGRVALGGVDYADIDWSRWRSNIGLIRPESTVISGSWVDNVAFLDENPDRKKIEKLLAEVGLAAHVKSLPKFLDSPVEARGANLSAGQRQRLLLARCLYRDPGLLLLDEPVSNLDAESESIINKLLLRLKGAKTVIVITHRESLMEEADNIYRTELDGFVSKIK